MCLTGLTIYNSKLFEKLQGKKGGLNGRREVLRRQEENNSSHVSQC
jgi:hypothetical protein